MAVGWVIVGSMLVNVVGSTNVGEHLSTVMLQPNDVSAK